MGLSRLLEDSGGRPLQLSEVADVLQKDERWKGNPKAQAQVLEFFQQCALYKNSLQGCLDIWAVRCLTG